MSNGAWIAVGIIAWIAAVYLICGFFHVATRNERYRDEMGEGK